MDISIQEFFKQYPSFSLDEYKRENSHLKYKKPIEWMHHYHMQNVSISSRSISFLVFVNHLSLWEEILRRYSVFYNTSFYFIFYEYDKSILEKNKEKYILPDSAHIRYRKINTDKITSRIESIHSILSEIDTEYYCVVDEKQKIHFSFMDIFLKDEKLKADIYVYLSFTEYIILLSSRYKYLYQSITPYPNSMFVEKIKYLGLYIYESSICYFHSTLHSNKRSYYITQYHQIYNHLKYQLRQFKNRESFPYNVSLKTYVHSITGDIDRQIQYIYACYLFCYHGYGNVLFYMDNSSPIYSFYDTHDYLPKACEMDIVRFDHLTPSFLDEKIDFADYREYYHFFHYLVDEETKEKIIQGKGSSYFRNDEEYAYYMHIDHHPLFGCDMSSILSPSMRPVSHVYFIEEFHEIKKCIYTTDVYAYIVLVFTRKCDKLYLEKIAEYENCYLFEGKVLFSFIDYIQSIAFTRAVYVHKKKSTFIWNLRESIMDIHEHSLKVKHWYSYLEKKVSTNTIDEYVEKEKVLPVERMVYVINLDERKDRLKHSREEWRLTSIPFQRFGAVRLSPEDAKKEVDLSMLWKKDILYMIGSASCKYSHRTLLEEVHKTNQPWVWIMEDDFLLEETSSLVDHVIQQISRLNEIDPEWRIFYLGVHLLQKEDAYLVDPHLLKLKPNTGLTTTGYIVQTKYIPEIVSILKHSKIEIDNTYMKEVEHRYCIYPMRVYQRDSYSDILGKNISYHAYHTKFTYEDYKMENDGK
jgi:GR25 family glycosyltransferase involved in LPS biosynthesis